MNFNLLITLFSHPLQLRAHLNGLPHSMHGTLFFMNFSLLKIILNIFHMNCLLESRKMTFTIHFIFTFLTFRPLFTTFCRWYLFYDYFSSHYTFLASTATLSSSLFFIILGILDMLQHKMFLVFTQEQTFLAFYAYI